MYGDAVNMEGIKEILDRVKYLYGKRDIDENWVLKYILCRFGQLVVDAVLPKKFRCLQSLAD